MPRRMPRRWNGVDARHNLDLAINQFELAADRWELGVREIDQQMPEMIIHRHSREVGMLLVPKIPLGLPHHIARVGEDRRARAIGRAADVIGVAVGQHDRVDVGGRHAHRREVIDQLAVGGREARAGIDKQPILAGVHEKTCRG